MKIGDIELSMPVILAPMAGVSDPPMREMVMSFGAGLTVSEMVPSNSQVILEGKRVKSDKLKKLFSPACDCVQIFGNSPDVMAEAARINVGLGAKIIDINMGCPANKIVGNDCGSALMKNSPLAREIVRAVVKAIKVPVSVKIRTGWNEENKNAVEFACMLEGEGASAITVHGRTRAQLFGGSVDLGTIAKVKSALKIPVVGNGDITSPELARAMIEATGVDAVMVGRGAMGRPWLLRYIAEYLASGSILPEPSVAERKQLLLRHAKLMFEYYGDKVGALCMRKHAAWYSYGLPRAAEFRRKINSSASGAEELDLVEEYFI